MKQEPVNCTDSELSTYLQALEAGYLPTFYLDTNPSAQSKLMDIASKSYRRGRKTVTFLGFRFLMTLQNSTADPGNGQVPQCAVEAWRVLSIEN